MMMLQTAVRRISVPATRSVRSVAFHSTAQLRCGLVAFVTDQKHGGKLGNGDAPMTLDPPTFMMTDRLKQSLLTLKHRGPDHIGSWVSEDGRVGLGHTRLSILDLAPSGHQPMRSEEHQVSSVVNGEIYDWERMRGQLEMKGCVFQSHSDSEVVLHMYIKYGINMVRDLRGEFAIAIHDEKQGVFHVVRDRFGIKPLYYARHGSRWFFASEMKALFALGIEPRWNIHNIAGTSQGWNQGPCFDGIQQLPPGHYATITKDGTLRLTRYWDADYSDRNIPDTRTDEEMIGGVRARLIDAVRVRLRSDVPVGVYLSGGIDSCTALGIASSLTTQTISAFNLSFSQHKRFDEASTASLQAEKSHANFHRVHIHENDLADNLQASLYHCEQSVMNTNGVAKFILSKFVRDHGFKVVLTGEGSDEIFAGYPPFREDLARYGTGIPEAEREEIIESLKKGNLWIETLVNLSEDQRKKLEYAIGYAPSWFRAWPPHGYADLLSSEALLYLGPARDQIQYLLTHFDAQKLQAMKEKWEVVHSSLYLESKTLLPGMLLTVLGDRNEMAHSIEGRLPFLDHPLVEYVNHLPSRVKIKGTREKWILREAAKPFITDEVYNRIKHPFLAPPSFLNPESRLHELVQSTLRSHDLKKLWWLDQEKVVAQLDELTHMIHSNNIETMSGPSKDAYYAKLLAAEAKFLSLVSFALLQQSFNVRY